MPVFFVDREWMEALPVNASGSDFWVVLFRTLGGDEEVVGCDDLWE